MSKKGKMAQSYTFTLEKRLRERMEARVKKSGGALTLTSIVHEAVVRLPKIIDKVKEARPSKVCLNVRLGEDHRQLLEEAAQEAKMTKSAVVVAAIIDLLDQSPR